MAISSSDHHLLHLLRQVELASGNRPLVVWLTRIAIKSITEDDNERIDATEELERKSAADLRLKSNGTPLYRKTRQSSPGGQLE